MEMFAEASVRLEEDDNTDVSGDLEYMRKHATKAKVYWGCTGVLLCTVFAVSQTIANLAYPQLDMPKQLTDADIAGHGLKTYYPWFKEDTDGVTGWVSDRQFLRYTTFLLTLTIAVTGLGLELVRIHACKHARMHAHLRMCVHIPNATYTCWISTMQRGSLQYLEHKCAHVHNRPFVHRSLHPRRCSVNNRSVNNPSVNNPSAVCAFMHAGRHAGSS